MNTSYKTTIIGIILAVFVAIQPILESGSINWKSLILAALIAALSYLAKDNNVTGGTVDNGLKPSKNE